MQELLFFTPPSLLFFLFISYLLLFHWFLPCFWRVSPFSLCLISSVLSNGSLGSFPHTVSLFPFLTLSIQPYVSFPCPISLPYRYTWGMKVLLEFFFFSPIFILIIGKSVDTTGHELCNNQYVWHYGELKQYYQIKIHKKHGNM